MCIILRKRFTITNLNNYLEKIIKSLSIHLIIFTVDQGQFEAVLCGVDGEDTWSALPVQAVNTVSSHSGHIDRQIQGPDDAMITAGT